jgi:hypothetical protein
MAPIKKPLLTYRMRTRIEGIAEADIERSLGELAKNEAVSRFMTSYGNLRTRRAYAAHLANYFRWLKTKGLDLAPDQLIVDNLRCIYHSEPEDVASKRKHRALLEEFANVNMIERGFAEISRLALAPSTSLSH